MALLPPRSPVRKGHYVASGAVRQFKRTGGTEPLVAARTYSKVPGRARGPHTSPAAGEGRPPPRPSPGPARTPPAPPPPPPPSGPAARPISTVRATPAPAAPRPLPAPAARPVPAPT